MKSAAPKAMPIGKGGDGYKYIRGSSVPDDSNRVRHLVAEEVKPEMKATTSGGQTIRAVGVAEGGAGSGYGVLPAAAVLVPAATIVVVVVSPRASQMATTPAMAEHAAPMRRARSGRELDQDKRT